MYGVINFLGQILFGGYFVLYGIHHFREHKVLTHNAAENKLLKPRLAVYVGGILLLIGGIGILVGEYTNLALWMIAAFLVGSNLLMNDYWNRTDPIIRAADRTMFYKNIALLGAIFLLM